MVAEKVRKKKRYCRLERTKKKTQNTENKKMSTNVANSCDCLDCCGGGNQFYPEGYPHQRYGSGACGQYYVGLSCYYKQQCKCNKNPCRKLKCGRECGKKRRKPKCGKCGGKKKSHHY